ncbi:MAG: MaoC family dehydratase [Candidatus Cloacimonetes bacterium]|nr:MaoC family dehydratase [Candidatus Cloacimonadota bacterium]
MQSFQPGQTKSLTRTFSQEDIQTFARLSGDDNPVHLDEEFAKNTPFQQRIAHGMLAASLFSALLGRHLPGDGTIYLGQNLSFKKPVFPGVPVTATVEILEIRSDKPIAKIKTSLTNSSGEVLIEGEAVVKLPV